MKQEYLNEEKYNKIKKILKTIGLISLCIGITLLIISFIIRVPNMSEEGWFEASKTKGLLQGLSFVFGLLVPLPIFFMAYGREITSFTIQQHMPIVKEGVEKMTPTMGNVAKEIAKGVKEGLKEDSENEEK